MKIEAELTLEEETILLLSLGYALGMIVKSGEQQTVKTIIRITNKLMAKNPNFIPYDESLFDGKSPSNRTIQ